MLFAWLHASLGVQWDARGGLPNAGGVIDLSAQAWANVVNGRNTVLVTYYTPWCPQCQKLEPKLESAAQQLPDVQIARINAEEEPGLKMRYRVHDYPEIHLFLPGASEPLSYLGDLQVDLIIDWVREMQRTGGKPSASAAPQPPRDTGWMRDLAAALAPKTGGCKPGERCHDSDRPTGGAAAAPPPPEDDRPEPNDADSAMRMAMDDAMHDAAAEANQKAMRVSQQLQAEEAAQRLAQQKEAGERVQGALGELLPLLPTLQAIAHSAEFRELAAMIMANLEQITDEQIAYLKAQPADGRVPLLLGLLLNLNDSATEQLATSFSRQKATGAEHPYGLTPILKLLLTPHAHLVPVGGAATQMAPLLQTVLGGATGGAQGGGALQSLLAAVGGGGGAGGAPPTADALQQLMTAAGSGGGPSAPTQQQPTGDVLQQMMASAMASSTQEQQQQQPSPVEGGGAVSRSSTSLPRLNMQVSF